MKRLTSSLVLAASMAGGAFGRQAPPPNPTFEIADVHASTTPPLMAQNFGGVLRDGRFEDIDATMLALIKEAYGIDEASIAGGPSWLAWNLYDVIATVPAGTTPAAAKLMLQSLLADRFQLVIHNDTRPLPRYVLTVESGGPKMKPTSGSEDSGCVNQQQPGAPAAGGRGGGGGPGAPPPPNLQLDCHNMTSAEIADFFHQRMGMNHDFVDDTELKGAWDFKIELTRPAAIGSAGSSLISIFDAFDKQLGLKLELKDVPEPAAVVEGVNEKPTANAPGVAANLGEAPPRFEAASIKPLAPDAPFLNGLLYTGGSEMHGAGTLRDMIAMAYSIPFNVAGDTVVGLPKSAETVHWDVTAKVPSTGSGAVNRTGGPGKELPPPLSVAFVMLQNMLADEFELKTHFENRPVTVYSLTVAGAKPKLTPAKPNERTDCEPDPDAPKPATNVNAMMTCTNVSMAILAQLVEQSASAYIDHPVVDATGLAGGWDFSIGWTPKMQLQNITASDPNAPPGSVPQAADPSGISLWDAVQKELGLKLVKQTHAIPVIVVDHVDEKPRDQ